MAEIIALILGPTVAVGITLWWQNKKEKRDAKIRLFTTLMAFRKSYPISYEWANALNLIDVVFADSPKVVERWHVYYDNLQDPGATGEARGHKYLELISEMAKELCFPLQQTDIDKFYVPQQHGNQADLNAEFQREFVRVLKNTSRFETAPISAAVPSSTPKTLADLPPITPAPVKDERPRGVQIFDPPDSN